MTPFQISLIVTAGVVGVGLLIYFIYWMVLQHRQNLINNQSLLSDRELLYYIDNQPDKMASLKQISEHFHVKKSKVRSQLTHLSTYVVLRAAMNHTGMKYFYALGAPIRNDYPKLSESAFLTAKDILILFKHCNYRLSLQDICIATGLPVVVIQREMKYFMEQKMINEVLMSYGDAMNGAGGSLRFYTLSAEYKNDPDRFLEKEAELNLELEKIYEKVK